MNLTHITNEGETRENIGLLLICRSTHVESSFKKKKKSKDKQKPQTPSPYPPPNPTAKTVQTNKY